MIDLVPKHATCKGLYHMPAARYYRTKLKISHPPWTNFRTDFFPKHVLGGAPNENGGFGNISPRPFHKRVERRLHFSRLSRKSALKFVRCVSTCTLRVLRYSFCCARTPSKASDIEPLLPTSVWSQIYYFFLIFLFLLVWFVCFLVFLISSASFFPFTEDGYVSDPDLLPSCQLS